jgi:hypothetical protein
MRLLALLMITTTAAHAAPAYVDAKNFPSQEAGWARFRDLEDRLRRGFDDICGDTFCEGEYSNIQHLRFRCSVKASTGTMGACTWTLAGSAEEVDPADGRIHVDARLWNCAAPLQPGTSVPAFYAALEGRDAIHAALPGGGPSMYDTLADCLN